MDLRDDPHTQLKDVIGTLHIISKLEPPSELIHNELTRWYEQVATLLETFILPMIKAEQPILDLRTGKVGNYHKVAPLVVGATSAEAAEADELGIVVDRPAFLNSHKP